MFQKVVNCSGFRDEFGYQMTLFLQHQFNVLVLPIASSYHIQEMGENRPPPALRGKFSNLPLRLRTA